MNANVIEINTVLPTDITYGELADSFVGGRMMGAWSEAHKAPKFSMMTHTAVYLKRTEIEENMKAIWAEFGDVLDRKYESFFDDSGVYHQFTSQTIGVDEWTLVTPTHDGWYIVHGTWVVYPS